MAEVVEPSRSLLPQQGRRCVTVVLDDRGVQIADRGRVRDGTIGGEHEILGTHLDQAFGVVVVHLLVLQAGDDDLVAQRGVREDELGDLAVGDEGDALSLQVGAQRQDDRLVLVVRRAGDPLQGVDPGELEDHAIHVAAQLGCGGDVLEGERGLPHPPEVRREEVRCLGEPIADRNVVEFALA